MNNLGFLCLMRGSGAACLDLLADVHAVVRPGDQVVIVDDSGGRDAVDLSYMLARTVGFGGWGRHVVMTRITTGTRGAGDLGVAAALALRAAQTERVIILPGEARLDVEAFRAARIKTGFERLDLLTTGIDAGGVIPADAPCDLITRMIFKRALVMDHPVMAGLAETPGGLMRLAHAVIEQAQDAATTSAVIGSVPAEAETLSEWCEAAQAMIAADPDVAPWVQSQLPGRVARTRAPGARIVAAEQIRALGGEVPPLPQTPPVSRGARIKVALQGPHTRCQPLAYGAFDPQWQQMAEISPLEQADVVVFSHPFDLRDLPRDAARTLERHPDCPVMLLSEEPFWDTLFSPDPLACTITLPAAHLGPCRMHQINHHTSAIFDWDRIPYFVLTDPPFATRYAEAFARNAAVTSDEWQARFAARGTQAAFMAERRPEAFHDLRIPAGDIVGLCAWRTRLAEGYTTGEVARIGASWGGGAPRLSLDDWHADKLALLDGHARFISGLENTHQPLYTTEKLFDAFACGGRPLYYASGAHRVHDLGLPAGAWVNLWGLDDVQAAIQMDAVPWDAGFYADYAAAQSTLRDLWTDTALITRERDRMGAALRYELARVVDSGPVRGGDPLG